MLRRIAATALALALLFSLTAAQAAGCRYSDVPPQAGEWALSAIETASEYGLIQGEGNGRFGFGNFMDRAGFVTALGRLFSWSPAQPDTPTFSDCPAERWYFSAVETAAAQGVLEPEDTFRPEQPITRREMAVMLMKALDYDSLAAAEALSDDLPFPDVGESYRGYIALAWRFGLINGVEQDGTLYFFPDAFAPREQVAALLVRAYDRLHGKTEWLHGFYAVSSYSQLELSAGMDAVSVGWARMEPGSDGAPLLNQTSQNGNNWVLPHQAELATGYFAEHSIPCNLCVYAGPTPTRRPDGSASNHLYDLLDSPDTRSAAVAVLADAARDYAGLTVDFEGLKAPLKDAFSDFIARLRAALGPDKALYVCVQPPDWYDGFDYRAIGEHCDKVILMAHDYQWPSVPAGYVGTTRTDTPVTPIASVWSALKAVTDPERGVQDRSKLALAISFAGAGLKVDENGVLLSDTLYTPASATIITRLRQSDTVSGWSDVYRNPYILYTAEDGSHYRLWYEDERSVTEKVRLARMLGIQGVSLWRLGNIPNYPDQGLSFDVWSALTAGRQTTKP